MVDTSEQGAGCACRGSRHINGFDLFDGLRASKLTAGRNILSFAINTFACCRTKTDAIPSGKACIYSCTRGYHSLMGLCWYVQRQWAA